ncbi:cbb3-type cytochrome oxidase assembly protein CcoS [Nafulsella turpanensis]|uniref:cbb3-type cytochrome oxidase assembly protein CcoS n=1 Tax=Nafulsella turpanensis TaxID=1265690 RepID=UPI00034D8C66|nr:cbb3-type cytochrome oxidase assembly protein CcoS [Nafulsella turpanensis]
MSALFILIAISLLVALGFLAAFLWATRSGQYDDDYTPAVRMLFDEGLRKPDAGSRNQENEKENRNTTI